MLAGISTFCDYCRRSNFSCVLCVCLANNVAHLVEIYSCSIKNTHTHSHTHTHLFVGQSTIRLLSESEYLPEQYTIRPHICFHGELAIENGLGCHPAHWQYSIALHSAVRKILFLEQGMDTYSYIRNSCMHVLCKVESTVHTIVDTILLCQ